MVNRIYVVGAVYPSPIGFNKTIELFWGMEPFTDAKLGDANYASLPAFANAKAAGNYMWAQNQWAGGFHGVDAKFSFTNVRYACVVFLDYRSGTNNITEAYVYGYDTAAEE